MDFESNWFETYRGSEHTSAEQSHSPQSQDQFPSHRHLHHQHSLSCQPLLSTFLWFQKLETLKCERMLKNAKASSTGRKLPCSLPLITWLLVYKTAGHFTCHTFHVWIEASVLGEYFLKLLPGVLLMCIIYVLYEAYVFLYQPSSFTFISQFSHAKSRPAVTSTDNTVSSHVNSLIVYVLLLNSWKLVTDVGKLWDTRSDLRRLPFDQFPPS